MIKRKYSYRDLERHLGEGMTYEQIGAKYGITKSAVSHALKRLKFSASRDLKQAQITGEAGLVNANAMHRLNRQANLIEEENTKIYDLMRTMDPEKTEYLRKVECPYCKKGWQLVTLDPQRALKERLILQDRFAKNGSQLRQLLSAIKDLMKEARDLAQIEEFKSIVIEEIACESSEAQKRILERIRQRSLASELRPVGGNGAQPIAAESAAN